MSFIYEDAIYFLLIFMRISGIFFFSPFFSSDAFNRRTRLGFTFAIAILIFPLVPKDPSILKELNIGTLAVFSIKETFIGMIIGYFLMLIFTVVQTASQLYSTDMGFGMVNVYDPMSQFQLPVLGQFKYLFLMAIFFIFGVHRNVIYLLTETFFNTKIGQISFHTNHIAQDMVIGFCYYFMVSVKLALPILGILFLVNILLGIMARIAPQMNVFYIGMPLKILVGFLFLITFTPYVVNFMEYLLNDGYPRLVALLRRAIN